MSFSLYTICIVPCYVTIDIQSYLYNTIEFLIILFPYFLKLL